MMALVPGYNIPNYRWLFSKNTAFFFQNTDTEHIYCIPSIRMYLQVTKPNFFKIQRLMKYMFYKTVLRYTTYDF